MRFLTALFLLPLAMVVGFSLVVPGALGVLAGLVVALLYYAVTVARASDWR